MNTKYLNILIINLILNYTGFCQYKNYKIISKIQNDYSGCLTTPNNECIQQLIRRFPDEEVGIKYLIAEAYFKKKDYSNAFSVVEDIIDIKCEYFNVDFLALRIYNELHLFSEIKKILHCISPKMSENWSVYSNYLKLGNYLYSENIDKELGISYIEKYFKEQDEIHDADNFINYILFYWDNKNTEKVRSIFEEIITRQLRAIVSHKKGIEKHPEFEEDYQNGIALVEKDLGNTYYFWSVFESEYNTDESLKLSKLAVKYNLDYSKEFLIKLSESENQKYSCEYLFEKFANTSDSVIKRAALIAITENKCISQRK